jgi:hypothetical protein
MDRSAYITQVKEMLQDSKVYKNITDKRKNPTTRTENDLQKMLKTICDSGYLSESDYCMKLRPFDSTAAAFYGLLKVHKIYKIYKKIIKVYKRLLKFIKRLQINVEILQQEQIMT